MLKELNYIVNGQTLAGESFKMASDTVNEIKVSFAFEGTDWSGLDSIKAVFSNNRVANSYEAVLVNGTCTIPHEVLTEKGTVSVNLYGSIITGTTLTTRITSYKSACVDVLQKVNVSGSNSVVPTPATWQQELSAHTQNTTVHVTAQNKTDWNAKSTVLVSDEGTATDEVQYITVNGVEKKLAGGGSTDWDDITNKPSTFPPSSHTHDDRYYTESETDTLLGNKQNTLVSGTNIKTINNQSVLGSGNIAIDASNVFIATYDVTTHAQLQSAFQAQKLMFVNYEGFYSPFVNISGGTYQFAIAGYSNGLAGTTYLNCDEQNNWSMEESIGYTSYYAYYYNDSEQDTTFEELSENLGDAIPMLWDNTTDDTICVPYDSYDSTNNKYVFKRIISNGNTLTVNTYALSESGWVKTTNTINIPQLPTIVNDRYLHTNSQGALEWSEVQGGGGGAKTGTAVPSTSTVADYVGQFYIRQRDANNSVYDIWQCVYIETSGSDSYYYWRQLLYNQNYYGEKSHHYRYDNSGFFVGDWNMGAGYAVRLGPETQANTYGTLALGWSAKARARNAIQLGAGINNTVNTLSVGASYGMSPAVNWTLLDIETGIIPLERITPPSTSPWTDAQRLAVLEALGCTVDANGFVKWTAQTE